MLLSLARAVLLALMFGLLLPHATAQTPSTAWNGTLRDGTGQPISQATIQLHSASHEYTASTSLNGEFAFTQVTAGEYRVSILSAEKTFSLTESVSFKAGSSLHAGLELSSERELRLT